MIKKSVHLHLHTEYSIRDSTIKITELVNAIKQMEGDAIAITDHGNVAGLMEFYVTCKKENIKPIVGMEAYIVKNSKIKDKDDSHSFHIILLAKNRIGWDNLIKLSSEMNQEENFYYRPRTDFEMIKTFSEGLIALTACTNSVLYLYGDDPLNIMKVYKMLRRIFGEEDLYLEIMPHDFEAQKTHNILVLEVGRFFKNSQLITTQDSHYLEPDDEKVHDMLMALQNRKPYGINSLYLTTRKEIYTMYRRYHEYIEMETVSKILDKTLEVADRIEEYNIPINEFFYPKFRQNENK
jgi:DNA polymerase-3 subunit alpha